MMILMDKSCKQEAFEKCWAHSPLRAATLPFIRCRYCRTPPLSHAACASTVSIYVLPSCIYTQTTGKNCSQSTTSFIVIILYVSIKSPLNLLSTKVGKPKCTKRNDAILPASSQHCHFAI